MIRSGPGPCETLEPGSWQQPEAPGGCPPGPCPLGSPSELWEVGTGRGESSLQPELPQAAYFKGKYDLVQGREGRRCPYLMRSGLPCLLTLFPPPSPPHLQHLLHASSKSPFLVIWSFPCSGQDTQPSVLGPQRWHHSHTSGNFLPSVSWMGHLAPTLVTHLSIHPHAGASRKSEGPSFLFILSLLGRGSGSQEM